ncbi:MAG: hypothetical protein EBS89_06100 [Proteobacteria bacterium]|nr:hypothetical protein [Pseudomonadota bacterium]
MIAWQYAYLIVAVRGGEHVVASIDGMPVDLSTARTPWDVLNELGADGWELTSALPTAPMQVVRDTSQRDVAESFWIFYLKRPRLARHGRS